ncbi:AsmA family protein [Shewanella acanthi]|uniref:AsmA family protein n=1 Tax=Shewanella acanthi TaxID=2864212 RepID=UPI001C662572|nr:AsmA family protein [Shewanella acanthi]QYJ77475.1 AsmA family protein [Shewanella acanthi]
MKFIKWLLGIVVILVLAVTLYLTVFFDPNDFKPAIVDAVKKQTGRELVIADDLTWTFFPTVGINLGGVTFSNPEGFEPKSMLEVNQAVAEVELMPLISKQIQVALLSLDGAKFNLVSRKNGSSSFDGLSGNGSKQADKTTTQANAQLASLDVGGVSILNTEINLIDETQGQTQTLTLKKLTLGRFSLDQFADLEYELTASLTDMKLASKGSGQIKLSNDFSQLQLEKFSTQSQVEGEGIPNNTLEAKLDLSAALDLNKQQLSAQISQLSAANINATGSASVNFGAKIPQIKGELDVGDVDLDALLPQSPSEQTAADSEKASVMSEPDLTALKTLDLSVKLKVKSVKVLNIATQNWAVELGIQNGMVNLKQLKAELYQGSVLANAQLDARHPVASYQFDKKISGIQIRPLLMDSADVDILAGAANIEVKGSGNSLIPEQLKKNLLATGKFDITDGALYGVNIPQMIRGAQAKLKGDLSEDKKAEKKTDFSSLTGTFSIENGIATNPDLAMSSPLLRVAGKGSANLMTEALDYRLTTSLVDSFKGQGGSSKDTLTSIDIPLLITGTFEKPEYKLDTEALFNNQLKDETNKAKDKLKDSLLKKLGGF